MTIPSRKQITCDNCNSVLTYDPSKIPVGRVTGKCKKCGGKIIINNIPVTAKRNPPSLKPIPSTRVCPNCKSKISISSETCDKCGIIIERYLGRQSRKKTKKSVKKTGTTESIKGVGFLAGGIEGIITGVGCLIPLGILLSCTGIGAIIGIPMILGGFLAPFMRSISGLSAITGKCPYCSHEIITKSSKAGINCDACKKRIVIRNKRFIKVE